MIQQAPLRGVKNDIKSDIKSIKGDIKSVKGDIKSVKGDIKSDIKIDEKTGNKFGRGIEFREGAPIQLLKYNKGSENEFGQIVLNPEALNILQTIHEPLAIISVGK